MSLNKSDLEIEVKFHLMDTEQMRQRITVLGAESQGRCFEHNIRFDRPDQNLRARAYLLRLRQDRKATLTFKSRPADHGDQFKIFRELEVTISDFETMRKILHALGFDREQIYEKWREVFTLERLQFCLDAMPFGNFLEIEGDPSDIVRYAGRLGLDWEKRILTNYLAIFEKVKRRMQLSFDDVTFDNFEGSADIPLNFMQQFEAGE